jgi:hypothetical protein
LRQILELIVAPTVGAVMVGRAFPQAHPLINLRVVGAVALIIALGYLTGMAVMG